MRPKHIYWGIIALTVAVLSIFMTRSYMAQETIKEYLADAGLTAAEVVYKSADSTLFDSGVILYKAQFPAVRAPHEIDKLIVRKGNRRLSIDLRGVSLNVLGALRQKDPDELRLHLKSYMPYRDAFAHPLESLALSGIDKIKFDARIELIEREKKQVSIAITLSDPQLGDILFSGVFLKPLNLSVIEKNPTIVLSEPIVDGVMVLKNRKLAALYKAYAQKTGIETDHIHEMPEQIILKNVMD